MKLGASGPDSASTRRGHAQNAVGWAADEGQSSTLELADREQRSRLIALAVSGAMDELRISKLDRIAPNLRLLLKIHDFLEAHGVALVAVNDSGAPGPRRAA
jgi:DNA invertase Pin-like site-specific DNA recombinase